MNFVYRLQVVDSISNPLKIYYDHASIALYSENNKRFSGSKHVKTEYLTVRYYYEYISTNAMAVYPIIEGLVPKLLNEHLINIGLLSCFYVLASESNKHDGFCLSYKDFDL